MSLTEEPLIAIIVPPHRILLNVGSINVKPWGHRTEPKKLCRKEKHLGRIRSMAGHCDTY